MTTKLAIMGLKSNAVTETFVWGHVSSLEHREPRLIFIGPPPDDEITLPWLSLTDIAFSRLPGFCLPKNRRPFPRLSRIGSDSLARFLKSHEIQLVLSEFGTVGVWSRQLLQRLDIPQVVFFHGVDATRLPRIHCFRRELRALFSSASGFVFPSAFLAGEAIELGAPPEKVRVVPYGVGIPASPSDLSGSLRFLAVGRFVPKKSPLSVLRSFGEVVDKMPEATLTMVGDGPLLSSAKREASRLGLVTSVNFTGELPSFRVQQEMRRANVFVQHSVRSKSGDQEGLPVAILEAMASGLPVVATRHAGIPEAVAHQSTGFLVNEGDVRGFCEGMLMFASESLRKDFGARARKLASERFSRPAESSRLEAVLAELVPR